MSAASPCVRLCQLDADGVCRGCFRQLQEIAGWMRLSDEEKTAVNAAAAERGRLCRQNNAGNE